MEQAYICGSVQKKRPAQDYRWCNRNNCGRLVQFEYKKKIDKDMAEDTEKPVIRKKYIPPYDSIWRCQIRIYSEKRAVQ